MTEWLCILYYTPDSNFNDREGIGRTYILFLRSWHLVTSLHEKYVGKQWKSWQTLLSGLQNHCRWDCSHEIKKKSYDKPRQHFKMQRHYFAYKGLHSQSYGFSSSHVWLCELDHKEGWALKNWCSWTVVLENIPESPLVYKEIKPGNPKEINPEYSLEGLMLKLKFQYCGHRMQRADLLEKTMVLGKIEGRRRRGNRGWDAGWHHWLNGHEFERTLEDGEGWGNLACCSPWCYK